MRYAPLLLGSLVLAGCLNAPGQDPGSDEPAAPLYAADCSIANWIEDCVALASPNDSPSKSEIDLAVNPLDPLNVIVGSKDNDKAASGCVWAIPEYTKDGGKTWTSVYLGGKKSERRPGEPLYGWGCITDPIIAFDKGGWAFYGLQAYNAATETNEPPNPCVPPLSGGTNSGSAFYLARSKDGGKAWDKIIPLHGGEGTVIYHDYPRMASNPVTGSTFVIWNEFDTAALPCNVGPTGAVGAGALRPVLAGTRDRGETPIRPVYLISPADPRHGDYGINGFAIDAKGKMYVTFETTKDSTMSDIWLISSTDDGNTWTAPAKIFEIHRITPAPGAGRSHTPTTRFRMGSSVELAVDNSNGPDKGCLYGAWVDNRSGHSDIFVNRSCDEGKTWTSPVQVNKDAGPAWQMMVRPVVSGDGVVHVGYMTQAYDPDRKLLDEEYAFSQDGGSTWTTQRLTNRSFDGDLGIHQDGGPFFGDYNGIGASGTTVYVGFPHSGSGRAEIAVGRIVKAAS
jgi:hypothetical protein